PSTRISTSISASVSPGPPPGAKPAELPICPAAAWQPSSCWLGRPDKCPLKCPVGAPQAALEFRFGTGSDRFASQRLADCESSPPRPSWPPASGIPAAAIVHSTRPETGIACGDVVAPAQTDG